MDMIAMLAGFGGPANWPNPKDSSAGSAGSALTSGGSNWSDVRSQSRNGSSSASVAVTQLPTPPAAVPSLEQYFRMRGLDLAPYLKAAANNAANIPTVQKQMVLDRVSALLKDTTQVPGIVGAWANYKNYPAPDGIVSFDDIQLATEVIDPVFRTLYALQPTEMQDIIARRISYSSTEKNNPKADIRDYLDRFRSLKAKYAAMPNPVLALRNVLSAASAARITQQTETVNGVTATYLDAVRDYPVLVTLATIYPPNPNGDRAINGIAWGRWWAATGKMLTTLNTIRKARNADVVAYNAASKQYRSDLAAWKKSTKAASAAAEAQAKAAADAEAELKIASARTDAERRVAAAEAEAKNQAAAAEKARIDAETARIAMEATINELNNRVNESATATAIGDTAAANESKAAIDALNAMIDSLKQEVVNAQNAAAEAARNANAAASSVGGDTSGAAAAATQSATDATQTAADVLQQTGEQVIIKPKEKKGGGVMLLVVGALAVGGYMWMQRRQTRQFGL